MVYVSSAFGPSQLLFISKAGYRIIRSYDNLGTAGDTRAAVCV